MGEKMAGWRGFVAAVAVEVSAGPGCREGARKCKLCGPGPAAAAAAAGWCAT